MFELLFDELGEEGVQALFKELRSGQKLMEENCRERERHAARGAFELRDHVTSRALGKPVLNMPGYEYFRLRTKYGEEAMGDVGFLRDIQKKAPEFKIASL